MGAARACLSPPSATNVQVGASEKQRGVLELVVVNNFISWSSFLFYPFSSRSNTRLKREGVSLKEGVSRRFIDDVLALDPRTWPGIEYILCGS
jgi:hypothetical protein